MSRYQDFMTILKQHFNVEETTENKAREPRQIQMYLDQKWYQLTIPTEKIPADLIDSLDVSYLQKHVFEEIFDIMDIRSDKRIDFVGGIRGLNELVKRVDSGEMKVAFSLYPVTIQQLFDIADSGNVMPPKSTWFEPKLRDGLLTHLL